MDHDETVAFNVVADIKDISMHEVDNNVDDEESIYSNEEDKEVIIEEVRDKYNPIYTKWVKVA